MNWMKSKVMTCQDVLMISVLLCLMWCKTAATFGDEFVHIKVHLPIDIDAEDHGPPAHVHSDLHSHILHTHSQPHEHTHSHHFVHEPLPSPPHKVIHHYHRRRRRPVKKNPLAKHSELLGSILQAEVDKPLSQDHYKYLHNAEEIAHHADTFIVKHEKPKAHVETFAVIEETKPKPPPIVETFKIIESKVPHTKTHHHEIHDEEYIHKPKETYETYNVIDGLFDDYHTHFKEPQISYLPPKTKHIETVKVLASHEPGYEHSHSHYSHYTPAHDDSDSEYNFDTKSHAGAIKIVEPSPPRLYETEYSKNYGKRPYTVETVEYVKAKPTGKSSNSLGKYPHQHIQQAFELYDHQNESPVEAYENAYKNGYQGYHDEHYTPEPEDTYLPPKQKEIGYTYPKPYQHHQHQDNSVRPIYEDEADPITNPSIDSFLPTLHPHESSDLDHSGGSRVMQTSATETYMGIDSYKAPHIQGVQKTGYHYRPPYL